MEANTINSPTSPTSPTKLRTLIAQVRDLDQDLAAQSQVRDRRSGFLQHYLDDVDRLSAKNRELTKQTEILESKVADENYKSKLIAEREERNLKKVKDTMAKRVEEMNAEMLALVNEERKQRLEAEDQTALALGILIEQFRTNVDLAPPPCTKFEAADDSIQSSSELRSLRDVGMPPVGINTLEQTQVLPSQPSTPNNRTAPLASWTDMKTSRENSRKNSRVEEQKNT